MSHAFKKPAVHVETWFLNYKLVNPHIQEGDEDLDSDKYPLPASEDAEPTLSRVGV